MIDSVEIARAGSGERVLLRSSHGTVIDHPKAAGQGGSRTLIEAGRRATSEETV